MMLYTTNSRVEFPSSVSDGIVDNKIFADGGYGTPHPVAFEVMRRMKGVPELLTRDWAMLMCEIRLLLEQV